MKKLNSQRNTLIKFSLEKLATSERKAEENSIAKINEFLKFQKHMVREVERKRDKTETVPDYKAYK